MQPAKSSVYIENISASLTLFIHASPSCLEESMANRKRASLKRKRQPEVPLRRSARLIAKKHEPPKTDLKEHKNTSSSVQTRPEENCDSPGSKRNQLPDKSPPRPADRESLDPIDYWRRSGFFWPKRDWSKNNESRLLARRRPSAASSPSTTTPSDLESREQKCVQCREKTYVNVLAEENIFMREDLIGIHDNIKKICRTLLKTKQSVPTGTLFDPGTFQKLCEALQPQNEARILRDVSQLLVPSAEHLALRGEKELEKLVDSVNEGWNNCISITMTRPQPDYAVGFRREAFTKDQLKKLDIFIGNILTQASLFLGTCYQYFPFLTCEVGDLVIADRRNAHSTAIAVRGVVDLFRMQGREKELDREILAFSISHDHCSVKIYGRYPVIEGENTTYYRHLIHAFYFTGLDGKEKWTSYRFIKNVYKIWMPLHFKRLCSAIDTIPENLKLRRS